MKRLVSVILAVLVLASCAGAYQLPFTNTYYNYNVFHEDYNNSSEAQVQMLYDLGLFKGRGEGDFALNEKMTREEAAVMVVRFLGGEKEVESGTFSHPFTDVAAWADNYVGWLYENGFTKGISADQYGGKLLVTCWQYSTFLSRAVRGNENGVATEEEVRHYDDNQIFCRETAVGLSVRALTLPYDRVDSMKTCAQYLCDLGIFTAEQFRDAAVDVIPSGFVKDSDGCRWRRTAGIKVAKCPVPDIQIVEGSQQSPRDYLHVTGDADGKLTLYILDYRTMEVLHSASCEAEKAYTMKYLTSSGQKDFLLEERADGFAGRLFAWNGESLETIISAEDLWKGEQKYVFNVTMLADEDRGALSIAGTDSLFFVSGDAVKVVPVDGKAELLGWDDKGAVLQTVSDAETVISCVDVETLTVTDEYRVAPDTVGTRTVTEKSGRSFYGTAGYYTLIDGRLLQITEMPTLKTVGRRVGAGGETVILCHDVGVRMTDYMGRPTGNKLYRVDTYTHALYPFMEIKPEWGVRVDEWWSMDSAIAFSTRTAVGMDRYDTYTYIILNGKLLPQNYEAGRSEFMTKTWSEYVWDEMDRLHALGASDPGPSAEDRANILAENAKNGA